MDKKAIIKYLKSIRSKYSDEGFVIYALFGSITDDRFSASSDIDILYETSDDFLKAHRGFAVFARLQEISDEINSATGRKIDFVSKNHLGDIGKKYIMENLIYV